MNPTTADTEEPGALVPAKPGWRLQKLTAKHKTIASLLAQGEKPGDIAKIAHCTREYVTMLCKQPLFIQYMADMNVTVSAQLDALFGKSVEVIADVLQNGKDEDRLKAAKLQMQATGKDRSVDHSRDSAEDLVAKLMQSATIIINQGGNVQVNQGETHGTDGERSEYSRPAVGSGGEE